jgi:hypothetical protein
MSKRQQRHKVHESEYLCILARIDSMCIRTCLDSTEMLQYGTLIDVNKAVLWYHYHGQVFLRFCDYPF